ncbi:HEPN domain-containing protein [Arthrobacter sp. CJ23]|uniref:HEPN domain-containing protein n=1 Tax=Arthrobacter sp. CJ23 TaxID=2972479 RepID=UPI00215C4508|nr:HEPN domain-containing protein [Arthrobacter sp. CJ23]UVJ38026.1 HEPN domain-containing protein [Arthrobacter sp. CJ23]
MNDAVDLLYQDYVELVSDLSTSPSGLSSLNRSYHKHLLVAAASSLEDRVKALVPEIFGRHGTDRLAAFVAKQVMARGYHTLFDWRGGTAQGFFTSFGEVCGQTFKAALKADDVLKAQHGAFMQLGDLRNQVVHNDYASALIELTPAEIIARYKLSLEFVDRIEHFVLAET